MQVKRLFITITILFSLLLPTLSQAQGNRPIDFPDTALRAKIAEALGKGRNATITAADMLALTELHAPDANIRNLTGIQHARNLKRLYLGGKYIEEERRNSYNNTISDLSPIQQLTQLTHLDLSGNDVSNLSPLSGLTALTTLRLYNNPILDLSPLTELTQLVDLELSGTPVSDISALKGLTRLTYLHLGGNAISDISALKGLTQLTYLYLWDNTVSDISALKGLTQLVDLRLEGNAISDISALKGLTQLVDLGLGRNAISDISALKGLTQLTYLYLWDNAISDISSLSGLKQLRVIDLSNNAVLDVSPLAGLDLPGTEWNSTGLYIERNPLSYTSIHTHIPAMQARGVEVKFDARVPTTLLKISDTAQEGIVNTALPLLFVVEVLDQEDRAFAGVPVKFAVTAGRGRLNATTVKTDAMGKAAAHLTLGRTAGTTTVRVAATAVSQPVEFTATAILRSSSVMIPDANLRMKIMETLGRPLDETPTASDMLKLTTLTANNANILDLTGLQHAANLTKLSLSNNRISNVSALIGLTQLTTLNLRNNRLSDVLPLIDLVQLKGAENWNSLYLQGNPLSDISIDTHIPMLQAAGVNVRFDSTSTQQRPIVRFVYFLPRDRQPQPDINAKADRLIKEIQEFYEKQMEKYGVGRKTFQFETDAHGNAVVYHINGKFDDVYYHDESNIVWREIREQFDMSKNIYLTALDVSTEQIGSGGGQTVCGTGSGWNHRGSALIPASGHCFGFSTTAHELGHAFGLQHDFRNGAYIMSYGSPKDRISQCAAEWLDVHRAFNASQAATNESAAGNSGTIEMLPPRRASSPNAIRFRFKVDDSDGLHQAQLHTETLSGTAKGSSELIDYKRLNGNSDSTVEFVTTYLGPENKSVSVQVIDKRGNMSGSERYSIDVASILSPYEVISIPDANLAAAIREEIGDSITTHTLLHLTHLYVPNQGITDLTGLEHAHNLRGLGLWNDQFYEEPVNKNGVSDFTPLLALTNLRALDLSNCSVSDISFLAKLTQLTSLHLSGNPISDVSVLAELTELGMLHLRDTSVSDISALSGLRQLSNLSLSGTSVSDISPLAALTQLTQLDLRGNNISNISLLADLTQLKWLDLQGNNISDISPLADLTQLTHLLLGGNAISDISALSGLTQLTSLNLSGNETSDVSPLAGLTQLTGLYLSNNTIGDVSPLAGLTQLKVLSLNRNSILDVSPLVALDLLGTEWESTGLYIEDNPLSYASLNTHIPAMQAKGIKVIYDLTLAKITGPWLWIIAPTERWQGGERSINVDSLAAASAGTVTEAEVAANGAKDGDTVGDYAWQLGRIAVGGGNNINDLLNRIGMTQGDINDHSAYALITLESATAQSGVLMRVGSDDAIKVWLNGEVVHNNPIDRGASDFQDDFTVNLEKGDNLLLVKVSERAGGWSMFVGIEADVNAIYKRPPDTVLSADVNGDGIVNIQDLVLVSSSLGQTGKSRADVNGDGVVNIQDLVRVAGALGEGAAASPSLHASDLEGLTAADIQQMLTQARQLALTDPAYLRGIAVLEQLLARLLPKETALLANYPNPFNPETWLPYQLATPAAVTLRIYAVNGALVRVLALGHQSAGRYQSRSRAAYWDGRNSFGEAVASGVYFYTLTAGDFTATRKMLIRK